VPCLNSTDPPARDLFERMGMGVHKTYLNLRDINSSLAQMAYDMRSTLKMEMDTFWPSKKPEAFSPTFKFDLPKSSPRSKELTYVAAGDHQRAHQGSG
jgi:hypothetical protein